jgi:hypothetical protein
MLLSGTGRGGFMLSSYGLPGAIAHGKSPSIKHQGARPSILVKAGDNFWPIQVNEVATVAAADVAVALAELGSVVYRDRHAVSATIPDMPAVASSDPEADSQSSSYGRKGCSE